MKKVISFIFLLCFITASMTISSAAATTDTVYTAKISGPASVQAGGTASFTITVSGISASNGGLLGVDIDIKFNPELLTYVQATALAVPDGWVMGTNIEYLSDGVLVLKSFSESAMQETSVSADDKIAFVISFTVKPAGGTSGALSFSRLDGADRNYNEATGTGSAFNFTVSGGSNPPVTTPPVTTPPVTTPPVTTPVETVPPSTAKADTTAGTSPSAPVTAPTNTPITVPGAQDNESADNDSATADVPQTTEAPSETTPQIQKGGCKSSAGGIAVLLAAWSGAAILIRKKKIKIQGDR